MLEYEGGRAMPETPAEGPYGQRERPFIQFLRYLSFGGLFIGMSVWQIEFDFGVPQFRLVFQPMLIAAAAAVAAVAARITMGPGRRSSRRFSRSRSAARSPCWSGRSWEPRSTGSRCISVRP
ncbi:hypothetical protein I552_5909 [Mycobacterium xenopi 3993]|nr:hypothetical protein I552_5909 [Mycobacterium xenopi 3993]